VAHRPIAEPFVPANPSDFTDCQVSARNLLVTNGGFLHNDSGLAYAIPRVRRVCSGQMPGSKGGGRRKGVVVREGSVAQARREAGLTLAEVAGRKLSRTAIHLIEKGLSRPSMETLKLIAHQTGKPMTFFLHSPEERSGIVADLKDLQKAKSYLAKALAADQAKTEPAVQAEVRMLVGQAEEWFGNAARADEHFETAIRILEQLGKSPLLRDAHMAYAELLEARRDIQAAAHHWKLAARLGSDGAISGESGELSTNTTQSRTA